MAQFSRPIADQAAYGSSATFLGGPTAAYDCVDEPTASDTDYLRITTTTNGALTGTGVLQLSSVTDPVSSAGHVLRWRGSKQASGGTVSLTIDLYSDSNATALIASSGAVALTGSAGTFADYSYTLTGAQADAITNYASLYVRIRGTSSAASSNKPQCSWFAFEVPNAVLTSTNAGAQPASSGTLTALHSAARSLTGAQPGASGTLVAVKVGLRTLAGTQPGATGTPAALHTAARSLSGTQPGASATLTASHSTARSASGAQPAGSATLTAGGIVARTLTGTQPATKRTLADSFNRADNVATLGTADSGQAWTNITQAFQIYSNQAWANGAAAGVAASAVVDAGAFDGTLSCDLTHPGGDNPAFIVRYVDPNNFVMATLYALFLVDSVNGRQLTGNNFGPTGVVHFDIVCEGARITAYRNGSVYADYTFSGAEAEKYRRGTLVGLWDENPTNVPFDNLSFDQDLGVLTWKATPKVFLTGRQAVATTSAADTFTRADSSTSLGTSSGGLVWSALSGTWGIASNQGKKFSGASAQEVAVLDPGVADGTYTIDVTIASGGNGVLVFRAIDDNNYLLLETTNFYKRDGGGFTILQGLSTVFSTGAHAVQVELQGATIRVLLDAVQVVNYSLTGGDATKYTTPTKIGLREYSLGLVTYDNLLFATLSGPSGTLTAVKSGLQRTLTGAQPAATGTLPRTQQALRPLTGAQPFATGALTRVKAAPRTLTGAQPFATGTVAALHAAARSLTGAQPAATGTLTRLQAALRTLTGAQPFATGSVTRLKTAFRALVGTQPSAAGTLASLKVTARTLSGGQPSASGALARGVLHTLTADAGAYAQSGVDADLTVVVIQLITFVGAGASSAAGNSLPGTTVAPGLPAGVAAGDLMICVAFTRNRLATLSIDQGWLTYNNYAHTTAAARFYVFYKIHTGTETAPLITASGGSTTDTLIAQIGAFRGASQSAPFTQAGATYIGGAAGFIGPIAGITIAPRSAVLVIGCKIDDWTGVPVLTGDSLTWAEIGDVPSTLGDDAGLVWDYAIDGGAGTVVTGKQFLVGGGTSANAVGVMLEIARAGPVTSLVGAQPSGSGTLARLQVQVRSGAGAQPSPTATLARLLAAGKSLASAQPAATGTLSRAQGRTRTLGGAQPFSSGTLTAVVSHTRSLSGAQPAAGPGTLTMRRGVTLTADAGSLSVSGGAATLTAVRSFAGAGSSYQLSGAPATFSVGRIYTLDALGGSYGLAGADADFRLTRVFLLVADAGAYALAGGDATVTVQRALTAATASYQLSGAPATLSGPRSFVLNGGSYVLSGQAASMTAQRTFTLATGAYVLSGVVVTYGRTLTRAALSYVLVGNPATLHAVRHLDAAGGAYHVASDVVATQALQGEYVLQLALAGEALTQVALVGDFVLEVVLKGDWGG